MEFRVLSTGIPRKSKVISTGIPHKSRVLSTGIPHKSKVLSTGIPHKSKVLSTGVPHKSLPLSYIRPESDRPRLSEVSQIDNVPVIDLGCENRSLLIEQIRDACSAFGFFQVVNHGVEKEVYEEMLEVGLEFFSLPVEEKMKLYSDDATKTARLSTSHNITKEKVHNWRDYLRLQYYPIEFYVSEWPENPAEFRSVGSNYCAKIRQLAFFLEDLISESLGLGKDHVRTSLGEQGQHMTINYYPTCPEPELTYGLPGHTDPYGLTILLQDQFVAGLQVFKDGNWVPVNPHPDAFVVNIGDQLQALSNGLYKSVFHRVLVNSDKPRISVASFICPSNNAIISAPKPLTADGSKAVYRDFTYAEYFKKFWSMNLDQEHCLELFKN